MYGIVGIYCNPRLAAASAVARGLLKMQHRGPDGEGVSVFDLADGSLALGHRRLSIIDLSAAGLQPMKSADGRYTITFNGEIYNYVELRTELQTLGHRFRTATDTEVLLTAWSHWREDCLLRLDGMFAFAIFDQLRSRLVCVRDQFGIKPLFFHSGRDGNFRFASEVPALLETIDTPIALDWQRIHAFLLWGDYDDG